MSDFRDPELEHVLRNAGAPALDVTSAYAQVQRRVRTVRRRRVAVATSAACVALFAVAAFALARPADPDGRQAASDTAPPADGSRLVPISTTSAVPTTAAPTTLAPTTLPPTTLETTSTAVTSEPPATATTILVSSSPPSPPPSRTTVPHANAPATTVATSAEQTFVGVGGRITVRLQDGSLVLVSYQPAAGFTAKVEHESGSHVEVHFESASHETTARVDVEGGQMRKRFEESDS